MKACNPKKEAATAQSPDFPRSSPFPSPRQRLGRTGTSEEREVVGFPAYPQAGKALERGLLGMGNRRWFKMESFPRVGNSESKRLKVAALNLFHPTASPLFRKAICSYYETASMRERAG